MKTFACRFGLILALVVTVGCGSGGSSGSGGGEGLTVESLSPPPEVTLSSGLTAYSLGLIASSFKIDTSVAAGANDTAHLLFTTKNPQANQTVLRYISKQGNNWSMIQRWNHGQSGRENAIAVDTNNRVHIVTENSAGSNESLTYATNASGSWKDFIVDNGTSLGLANDIWVDPIDNTVHIAHFQWAGSNLRYTTNAFGGWDNEIVDSASWNEMSIFTDSIGATHIIYKKGGQPHHITNSSGQWLTESVGLNAGGEVSAVIDQNDNVFILSLEGLAIQSGNVLIVTNLFHSWDYQPAELDEDSLAIDNAGNLHLSFFGYSVQSSLATLVYASDISGSWQVAVVDYPSTGIIPKTQPSIAISQNGQVHLIFTDPTGAVMYTSFSPFDIL